MKDLEPIPLTKTEKLHFAFIDKLFAKKDIITEQAPPNETKIQTQKELEKEFTNAYEMRNHLPLNSVSWEYYLYEIDLITYEQFKAYGN